MRLNGQSFLSAKLEIKEVWANLENPDLTMEQAVAKLEALGNEVVEVDEKNRRIKLRHVENDERWVCDYCGAYSIDYEVIAKHERDVHNKDKNYGVNRPQEKPNS